MIAIKVRAVMFTCIEKGEGLWKDYVKGFWKMVLLTWVVFT